MFKSSRLSRLTYLTSDLSFNTVKYRIGLTSFKKKNPFFFASLMQNQISGLADIMTMVCYNGLLTMVKPQIWTTHDGHETCRTFYATSVLSYGRATSIHGTAILVIRITISYASFIFDIMSTVALYYFTFDYFIITAEDILPQQYVPKLIRKSTLTYYKKIDRITHYQI